MLETEQRHRDQVRFESTEEWLGKRLDELGFGADAGRSAIAQALPTAGDEPRSATLERALRELPIDFDALPVAFEGESKSVRLWTDRVVVMRFKPTVYSYTHNRYGEAPGTDVVRLRFAAALFREMAALSWPGHVAPRSAFLAELDTAEGPLLVQRRVETCNVETRVKRFHIGSPLHRYLYTDRYETNQACGPLRAWSRLDRPVVCFDWRHPLVDEEGRRLADEPISDDYAAVWIDDVPAAKELARGTFTWLERRFAGAGLQLVDMCLFIDRAGRSIYGEISPDCMRVRLGLGDPGRAKSADKDVWRRGGSAGSVLDAYREIYERLFGDTNSRGVST
jgi:phosphoribosylaminoimidazole-succinocarboxamide synthase